MTRSCAAATLASLLTAACGEETVEFPGPDVEPRWMLTAVGESDGEAIAVLPDGDLVALIRVAEAPRAQIALGGETYTLEEAGILVLKLSAVDGSVLATTELRDLSGSRIEVMEDGDLLISALGPGVEGVGDTIMRMSGEDLSLRWMRTLPISGDLAGARVAVDEAGDVYAAHANLERLHVQKLSGVDGNRLWTSEPVNSDSEATDVIALPGGDVVVTGFRHIGDRFENVLLRLDGGDGTPIWQQEEVDLGGNGIAEALELTDDGELLVASSSPLSNTDLETYAARVDLDGEVIWTRDICVPGYCYGTWPFPILLRGTTALMTVYDLDTDILMQEFSADEGDLEPPVRVHSSGYSDNLGGAALDEDGRFVLTGTTGQDYSGDDYQPGSAFILAL